jgi:PAS domain S-box-containing protein
MFRGRSTSQGTEIRGALASPGVDDASTASADALRLALLVNQASDYAMFLMDRQGVIQTWNTGAERIKGYKPSEIVGKHFSIFYTDEDEAATTRPRSCGSLRRRAGTALGVAHLHSGRYVVSLSGAALTRSTRPGARHRRVDRTAAGSSTRR